MVERQKGYTCELGHTHRYIQDAVNCEHFNLDKICTLCGEKKERNSTFCDKCGSKLTNPIPCEGHKPGNMVEQGFKAHEWMSPIPVSSDYAAWGRQCRKCGYVEYDNYSGEEDWR